jgi:hypothetical protein
VLQAPGGLRRWRRTERLLRERSIQFHPLRHKRQAIGGDWSLNRSFLLRPKGFNNAEGLSTIRWSDIARCYSNTDAFDCSTHRNGATYLSPEWSGFSFGWGYYKDDIWSASVRYKSPKE